MGTLKDYEEASCMEPVTSQSTSFVLECCLKPHAVTATHQEDLLSFGFGLFEYLISAPRLLDS